MMNELITVIVPVYKVEPYIHRCVDSIIHQTYKNLEIILIDDGSPDNCGFICDEYAKQDNRIRVIHKKNGGLSDARNIGIDISRGDYLSFIDSDDWIDPDMYEILINDATANNADISCCGYYMVYNDGSKHINARGFSDNKVFKGKEIFKKFFLFTHLVVCNKIYRKHIFNEIRFPLGKIYEDDRSMFNICDIADIATWNPLPKYYYYFQRDGSIMNTWKFENQLDKVYVLDELMVAVAPKFPELINQMIWKKNRRILDVCADVYLNHCEYAKSEQLRVLRKQIDLSAVRNKESSSSVKLRCSLVLIKYIPILYKNAFKIKRFVMSMFNKLKISVPGQ